MTNEQLQIETESDSVTIDRQNLYISENLDFSDRCLDPTQAKGLAFAMAIKARATGVRPIVEDTIFAAVELDELTSGKTIVRIRHRQQSEDRGKLYYSSSLTNRSSERIRIDRFGTYIKKGKTLVLYSLTGGFSNHQQFCEWYGVDGEWIEPGQTVTDISSHSNPDVYWVYFGRMESGKEFLAGARWQKKQGWFW